MADAIVGATVQILSKKALSLATDSIGLMFGFKGELEDMRESMVTIQALLADADDKQSHSKAVQLWLKRLEGVAFDAVHALDELHYETLRRQVVVHQNQRLKGSKVCFFFSFSHTRMAFRWRMASKVRDINKKLKKINQEAHDFGLNIRHQIEAALPHIAPRVTATNQQTDSILPPYVVGRTNDESRILEMLLSSSEEVVSVTAIIGMGGLGKTTLAKLIYNNPKIDEHFAKKFWVCVSDKFEVIELFKLILESLTGTPVQLSSRDAILQEIRRVLEEKRYLLVLDDVWSKNQTLWDDFLDSLAGLIPTNGSRCLVTTRLEQVAFTVSRHSPYQLGKLSDDDCWSILTRKASKNGEFPKELIVMKQQILKRCGGLPLAASVLGGLLRGTREEEWFSIVENKLLTIKEDECSIEQILKLSFDNLPSPAIKKCFAYCSIFSKDTEMEKNLLIELWMAEDFLQPDLRSQSTMEDTGDQYIGILLKSSLLEEVKCGTRTSYKMHDLVHDLAESISKSKLENGEIDNHNQLRYLALNSSDGTTEKMVRDMSTSVRTLFLKGTSCDMLPKFKKLHVLNLGGADLEELPTSIGELIHLRFLLICDTIRSFPESVCKLYHLQTLRIKNFNNDLPKGLSNLISLRHLYYKPCNLEDIKMPLKMGRLTCLQTLEFFNVGEEKGRQIEELRHLKDLKGILVIRNLELVNGKEGAERANLSGKSNILKLKLEWSSRDREVANSDGQVLEGLQPQSNLEELEISNFMGDPFPRWLINLPTRLDKLVKLRLIGCKKCREIPAGLGQLPSLQNIHLKGLQNIKSIGHSFYAIIASGGQQVALSSRKLFPALKILVLEHMGNLEEWMEPQAVDVDAFPMLESLTIAYCSKLVDVPSHFASLRRLRMIENDHVLVVKKILSKVTNLKWLTIVGRTGMAGLTCLSDVALSHQLENLKSLVLSKCRDLTSFRGCSTSLEELIIVACDNLRELKAEPLSTFQSLRHLEIRRCARIHLVGQQSLPMSSLRFLRVAHCEGLANIMVESCASLYCLHVEDCPNLVSFPMLEHLHESSAIVQLSLRNCPKLLTMPKGFGSLRSLWELEIGPFLDDSLINNVFDWDGLISSSTLHVLDLHGMPHMKSLPDELQYLTSLLNLHLCEFGIEALPDWIGNLASLENLCLEGCEKVGSLPSVSAMRRLTKLNVLSISGCPLLKERCNPQKGADSEWSKISHIPDLLID